LFNTQEQGKTGDVIICTHETNNLLCVSPKHNPEMFAIQPFTTYGKPYPVELALSGKSGVMEAIDHRDHNVIAAFDTLYPGLGIISKQDTIELYADIREQLKVTMQWLLLLTLIGATLLRSQLKSLARKLVASEAHAADKEQQISTLLRSVGEGILTIDDDGIINSFNTAAENIFGQTATTIIGQHFKILMPVNTHQGLDATMARYRSGDSSHIIGKQNVELPGLRSDGSIFRMELNVNEMHTNNRHLFVAIVRDITERKKSEEELFAEKERLRVTLRSIGDAVITTDINGLITYLNPIAEIMTGWSNEEACGKPTQEVFHVFEARMQGQTPFRMCCRAKLRQALWKTPFSFSATPNTNFP
jgi:PAS domain S-box-containing protein